MKYSDGICLGSDGLVFDNIENNDKSWDVLGCPYFLVK